VLAKDPRQRYQTATEFAQAFSQAIRGSEDFQPAPKPASERPAKTEPEPAATRKLVDAARQPEVFDTDKQTVIVHNNTSPWVLLGGFAIIAVAMIAVVLLVVKGNEDNSVAAATTTPTVMQVLAPPTETPTLAPPTPTRSHPLGGSVTAQ